MQSGPWIFAQRELPSSSGTQDWPLGQPVAVQVGRHAGAGFTSAQKKPSRQALGVPGVQGRAQSPSSPAQSNPASQAEAFARGIL
jgi:hypothetical protein